MYILVSQLTMSAFQQVDPDTDSKDGWKQRHWQATKTDEAAEATKKKRKTKRDTITDEYWQKKKKSEEQKQEP